VDSNMQVRISRRLSYLLRHNPEQFDVELDPQGFADLQTVAEKLGIRAEDIQTVVEESTKRRFEIVGNRVRALYGHSVGVDLRLEPVTPPEILYHGTSWRLVREVMEKGLKPMGRLFVHLSGTEEEARQVGRRREPNPAVIRVQARRAYEDGLAFYRPGDVYLVPEVPPEYLSLPEE
jgi:putative RNA 2'-phosphotransferase